MKNFCFLVKNYLGMALIMGVIIACSPSDNSAGLDDFFDDSDYTGFIHILSTGRNVTLGTDVTTARSSERPQMTVAFDYDYDLGRTMVTCGEYNALMETKVECSDDSLPATGISYYDAVLFANEKSKSEKLDTAYTYLKGSFDEQGHCNNLEGFAFLPDVDAYRLPTEAEWVFAASKKWNPAKGWNSSNSDSKLHRVCTAKDEGKSQTTFCDMSGNAMEWVGDWMGSFRDTTVTDYVGAPDGGSIGERVVKGGSFRSASSSVNLYSRGDVYTVTSSTRAEYVGFRLAFGKIPGALWLSSNGAVTESPVRVLANSTAIKSLTGTYHSKIAFRNDVTGNLDFINYLNGNPAVTEIVDTMDVYHPAISPNGKRVAFSTRFEGISGSSELYVRDLNGAGSNLVKLDVESAAIPRWRVVEGDTEIVYVSSTANNENESDWKSQSTWAVSFNDGAFGTPRKLFDGTFNGGVSLDDSFAVSGSKLLRAHIADSSDASDTVWYNGEQACNVSVSALTGRVLFLDFGGQTGRDFVGEKYSAHERLLIMDPTGKLIQSVAAPEGYEFDHTEWVQGSENIVVATLTNIEGAHRKIVLVNIEDSSIVDVAEGEELWHPDLWAASTSESDLNADLDMDSLGVYMTETSDIATRIMKVKMEFFWQYRDSAEVVILSSSRTFSGVDPELITYGFALNLSYSAQDLMSSNYFVENYFLPLMPKLKVLVLSLDFDRWYIKDENWNLWFANLPGYRYDESNGFWKNEVPKNMDKIVKETLGVDEGEYDYFAYHRGLFKSSTTGYTTEFPDITYTWLVKDKDGVQFNLQKLENIVRMASEKGVTVVGAIFPQSPLYYSVTKSWGRYGPLQSDVDTEYEAVEKLAKSYDNFIIMDEYKKGENDYTLEEFANDDHLGLAGAAKFTQRLDSLLLAL